MKRAVYALVALTALLTGCSTVPANQAHLTVHSEPLGALIYSDNALIGRSPIVLKYSAIPGQTAINTRPITAVWPSNAQASNSVHLSELGKQFNFTLKRPMNAPGLHTDMAFDAQVRQQMLAKQEQDRKDQAAAGALILGSMLSGYGAGSRRTTQKITPFSCMSVGHMTYCD